MRTGRRRRSSLLSTLPVPLPAVQRNVGNLATHKDMNAMSCIEYAVNGEQGVHRVVTLGRGAAQVLALLGTRRRADQLAA